MRDINNRWARPLEFSGQSSASGGRFWRRPAADGLELFDPAWRVLLRTHRGVVSSWIDIGLASAEHQKYQPDHLVRDGDDGFLVRLAHHQAAVLCGQRALGVSSGVGAFAQDKPDHCVAVAGAPGFALARALVVARAQCGPICQALGAAEARHVVANLDQNQRGGNLVDAGDGLQQLVRPGVGVHRVEQAVVDLGKLLLQRLDMGLKMRKHEQVPCAEITLQTGAEFLALLLELTARQAEYLFNGLAFDQCVDHGTGRYPVDVTDHPAKLNAAIVQYLA